MKLMSLVRNNGIFWTFVRYIGVGGASFLVDFACFMALVRLGGFNPALAQVFSRTVGAASGFLGHKYFSFAHSDPAVAQKRSSTFQMIGYLGVTVFGITVSPFVIELMLWLCGGRLLIGKLCTEVVMVCINFVAMRALFGHVGKKANPLP
ncbi:GtrA family protein [Paraburkholderia phymatum]|uniref:GtrA family protein n=1 Tax=Paraburkholderia phymatum TaxID=148447 RepID=A0ACC6TUV5_9BURK